MITCSSIRGHVNSIQIGLNTSVSCVEKEDFIITKKFRSINAGNIKDIIDLRTFQCMVCTVINTDTLGINCTMVSTEWNKCYYTWYIQ